MSFLRNRQPLSAWACSLDPSCTYIVGLWAPYPLVLRKDNSGYDSVDQEVLITDHASQTFFLHGPLPTHM
eukprot:8862858-Prorocentrum_lima.AAC.1